MAFSSQFAGAPWLNAPQKANGLLGLLGVSSNPFTDFLGNNSNALIGLGAGIAGGGPDLGQAVGQGLTLAGQGKTADFNRSEKAKADATLAANQTMTQKWLAQNRPDLVGLPTDQAWTLATQGKNADGSRYLSVGGGKVFDQTSGQYIQDPQGGSDLTGAIPFGLAPTGMGANNGGAREIPALAKTGLEKAGIDASGIDFNNVPKVMQPYVARAINAATWNLSPEEAKSYVLYNKPPQGGGDKGAFSGTSMDAQIANILLTGDPSSKEYAYAYNLATQPKMTLKDTPQGIIPVYETPQLPPNIRPPTFAGAQSAPPAPASVPPAAPLPAPSGGAGYTPAQPNVAPIGGMGVSAGSVIPGTSQIPKPTEQQVRSGVLSDTINTLAPTVLKNFDVLADPVANGLALGGPLTNWAQSPEYQQASAAMKGAIQTIVFQLSGANTGTNEMANTAASMSPAIFDKPETIALKKQIFISYVKSIAEASNDPQRKAAAQAILDQWGGGGGNTTSTGVQWSVSP